jgi:hypothetical protein
LQAPFTDGPQSLRVSAILISFNQAAALRRAIQALEQSTNRAQLEIVVADCGSADGSAAIDAEFPSVHLLRMPHHVGAIRAMNIAIRTAKADLLLFLSPSVEVAPGTAAALADRLEADPAAIAACPLLVDPQGNPRNRLCRLPDRASMTAAAKGSALPHVQADLTQDSVAVEYPSLDALLVRKQFIRGMNYFDQRYGHYWGDADLAMQARRAGKKMMLYPGLRAVLHPDPDPLENQPIAAYDRAVGAVAFVSKYEGLGAALSLRLTLAAGALADMEFGRFAALLRGQKLDGSQAH